MKKIALVALMALCGVSFSFGESLTECVRDCTTSVSPLIRKQKAVDETKCIDDCESKDQEVLLHENVQNAQSDGYTRQQVRDPSDPKGKPTR